MSGRIVSILNDEVRTSYYEAHYTDVYNELFFQKRRMDSRIYNQMNILPLSNLIKSDATSVYFI